MMKTTRSKIRPVSPGSFRIERFRKPAEPAAIAQPKKPPRPSPHTPRPDLLPARMRGPAAQAKAERPSGGAWRGAPRPTRMGQPSMARAAKPEPAPRTAAGRPGTGLPRKPAVQRAEEAQEIEMVDMSLHLQRNKLIDVVVSGAGLSHGTCIQKPDHQLVEVGHEFGDKNAYYLPWENGRCTEATVTLEAPPQVLLHGSPLRLQPLVQVPGSGSHRDPPRSSDRVGAPQQAPRGGLRPRVRQPRGQESGLRRLHLEDRAIRGPDPEARIDFMVYAAVEQIGMTFYVQERRTRSTTNASTNHKTEARELVRELGIPVLPQ